MIELRRLLVVSDITCDVGGSIEFLEHTTSIDKPYLWYDPLQQKEVPDGIGGAVLVAGVDILPSELPRDSSMYFGNALLPILDQLIASQQTGKRAGYGFALSALSPELVSFLSHPL